MATDPRTSTSLGPLVALGTLMALAGGLLVGGLLWAVLPETPLPFGFKPQHQDAETLVYALTFLVIVPLSVGIAARVADRVVVARGAVALTGLTGGLTVGFELLVIVSRMSRAAGGGFELAVAGVALWWVAAVALLHRATRPGGSRALTSLGRGATQSWIAATALLAPVVVCFSDPRGISMPALVASAAVVLLGVAAVTVLDLPRLPGWVGLSLDLAVTAVLVLAVPAVVIFGFDDPSAFEREVTQFHQDFFLGPVNQVLAGDILLVDVLSQYGVGSIYFLAGVFQVLPIGNGTLGLAEGGLSVLMYVGTYAALRLAGVRRLLAAGAMAVAVVALVFGLITPVGGLLQHGAIRYGLPVGVVLGAVLEARGARAPGRVLTLATVAIAAVWALESFAYTLLTAGVGAALLVVAQPGAQRARAAVGWAIQLIGACVAGHLVLAAGTWAAADELPRWGWYTDTLRAFLVGPLGELTYDFSSYSPGLVVGALYVASACGLLTLVVRRRAVLDAHRPAVVATGVVTAHGVALFSYLVNRSADHIVPYVCLPAVALVALWLHLLGVRELAVPARARQVATGIALVAAVLLVASTWSIEGYERSALAHAVPGGPSLRAALAELRDLPDLQPGATEGERLLEVHLPGEDRSIVLTGADLSIEVLTKAERGNRVPLGDPFEDSFVPEGHLERLEQFVDGLAVGDRAVLDTEALERFEAYRADPSLDPAAIDLGPVELVPRGLALLQKWVIYEIAQRFDLERVATGSDGLSVVELVPRRP